MSVNKNVDGGAHSIPSNPTAAHLRSALLQANSIISANSVIKNCNLVGEERTNETNSSSTPNKRARVEISTPRNEISSNPAATTTAAAHINQISLNPTTAGHNLRSQPPQQGLLFHANLQALVRYLEKVQVLSATNPQFKALLQPFATNFVQQYFQGVVPSANPQPQANFSALFNNHVSTLNNASNDPTKKCLDLLRGPDGELPQKLRNIERNIIEQISNEIMEGDPNIRLDDIAGLQHAKECVTEMVIWPLLRPDIFKGCRSPGKGLLLFGPPGTGKTMIGKAIAGESKATFFYISASSIMSKWLGEGEKLVRALFGVASCRQYLLMKLILYCPSATAMSMRQPRELRRSFSLKWKDSTTIVMNKFYS